jgi:ferric-dicitrate binding protein FerR (iron transport regulator)
MTRDTDHEEADAARQIERLAGALPSPALEPATSEQIARRARDRIGKPPRRRWILAIVAVAATATYAVWMILQILTVLGAR